MNKFLDALLSNPAAIVSILTKVEGVVASVREVVQEFHAHVGPQSAGLSLAAAELKPEDATEAPAATHPNMPQPND